MSNCCEHPKHTNGFIVLNNVPYVLAEYLDQRQFQQVERSRIRSEVNVDNQTECMRTLFDISIDDIGIRGSDGMLNVEGNNAKQRRLIDAIRNTLMHTHGELETLRKELVLRLRYQIENVDTGHVIRSMSEDLVVKDRAYYVDTNAAHIDENAILVNFNDTLVSTVNHFTHGHHRMILRITGIEMFYRCLRRDHYGMHPGAHVTRPTTDVLPSFYGMTEGDFYEYHKRMQQEHMMGIPPHGSFGHEPPGYIVNPAWVCFNRFYHFDNNGRDLVLHQQEINDPRMPVFDIPCGKVSVNRMVTINPGQRLVFKFSVWKNDTVVVNDTTSVMHALRAPSMDMCGCYCDNMPATPPMDCGKPVPPQSEIHPDYETLIRMMHDSMKNMNRQNYVINNLTEQVNYLQSLLENGGSGCNPGCPGHEEEEPKPTRGPAMTEYGTYFKTLQEGIDAVQSGRAKGTIVLQGNVCEELVIRGDVTINLNGYTVSAPEAADRWHHTFLVDGGNLVINGEGTVENGNNQGYCVFNAAAGDAWVPSGITVESLGEGTVILNGGTYKRTGKDDNHRGYALVNHGARMTINDNVVVDTVRDDTSLVTNGFMSDPTAQPVMIINGGIFRGGRHTVNNDHGGRIIINGGMFKMGTPWSDDFSSGPKNVFRNEEDSTGIIKGGDFIGNVENTNIDEKSLQISGGKFTVNVSKFLVDGKKQDNDGTVIGAE